MDTDDTNDTLGSTDHAHEDGGAALASPALPPHENATADSLVASPAVPGAGPLSGVLQDLHECAAGYVTRDPTGP